MRGFTLAETRRCYKTSRGAFRAAVVTPIGGVSKGTDDITPSRPSPLAKTAESDPLTRFDQASSWL